MECCNKSGKGKDTKKGTCATGPRTGTDQLGENAGLEKGVKGSNTKKA